MPVFIFDRLRLSWSLNIFQQNYLQHRIVSKEEGSGKADHYIANLLKRRKECDLVDGKAESVRSRLELNETGVCLCLTNNQVIFSYQHSARYSVYTSTHFYRHWFCAQLIRTKLWGVQLGETRWQRTQPVQPEEIAFSYFSVFAYFIPFPEEWEEMEYCKK